MRNNVNFMKNLTNIRKIKLILQCGFYATICLLVKLELGVRGRNRLGFEETGNRMINAIEEVYVLFVLTQKEPKKSRLMKNS